MRRQFRGTSFIPFVFSVLLLAACSTPAAKAPKADNINANITNQGTSVSHNGWIYFANLSDNGYLYKINDDLTGEAKVSDVTPGFLNAQGDWLYFTNGQDMKLYKIKLDGSGKTLLSDEGTQKVILADDWIYYIKMNTGNKAPGSDSAEAAEDNRIFRIKTDGTGRQKLSGEMTGGFNLANGWIYYTGTKENILFKMKTDGTENAKVSDVPMGRFSILDDYIYYIEPDPENPRPWRMKLDGTGAVKLSDDEVITMNPSGGWIYYGGIKESEEMKKKNPSLDFGALFPNFELKKMKLDGSEATVVNDDGAMLICVHGDTLAYLGMDMTNFSTKLTFLKTDAANRKDYVMPMNISNDNQNPEKENSENENPDNGNLKGENVQLFKMDEEASTGEIQAKLISAFSLGENLIENLTVTNLTGKPLELSELIAFIDEADNVNNFAAMYYDITGRTNIGGEDPADFQVPLEKMNKRMSLQPNETKVLQVSWDLNKKDVKTSSGEIVFIGLFDQKMELKALIEFVPVNKENPEKENPKRENVKVKMVKMVKVDEDASTGEIQAKPISAFFLGEQLIANLSLTNLTGKPLELSQLIAFIDEADNVNDFAAMYYDITNILGKDGDGFFDIPMEIMDKRMSLQPNETKILQLSWDLNKKDVKISSREVVNIGLFDQKMELKALIRFRQQ